MLSAIRCCCSWCSARASSFFLHPFIHPQHLSSFRVIYPSFTRRFHLGGDQEIHCPRPEGTATSQPVTSLWSLANASWVRLKLFLNLFMSQIYLLLLVQSGGSDSYFLFFRLWATVLTRWVKLTNRRFNDSFALNILRRVNEPTRISIWETIRVILCTTVLTCTRFCFQH